MPTWTTVSLNTAKDHNKHRKGPQRTITNTAKDHKGPQRTITKTVYCVLNEDNYNYMVYVIFAKYFVHVACIRGLVLLRHVYDRPHRLSLGRGFLPHWKCIINHQPGKGDGSAQRGWSMLSTIALFYNAILHMFVQKLTRFQSLCG